MADHCTYLSREISLMEEGGDENDSERWRVHFTQSFRMKHFSILFINTESIILFDMFLFTLSFIVKHCVISVFHNC